MQQIDMMMYKEFSRMHRTSIPIPPSELNSINTKYYSPSDTTLLKSLVGQTTSSTSIEYGLIAQLVEHSAMNQLATGGSNPFASYELSLVPPFHY